MKFIDANVIIKAFTDNEDKEKCRDILYEDFVTNTLCLVEAQHSISTIKKNNIYAANCIKSLFKSNCVIVQLDKNLLFESFKRIEKYSLNIFDLINYVTALVNNCSHFVSYDAHFDDLEIKRIEP
jgi:predicted nucleic acid-binding protein